MKIPVADLVKGIYVIGLDSPWSRTPFFRHQFLVESEAQIRQIKSNCQFVNIDLARSKLTTETFDLLTQQNSDFAKAVAIEIDKSAKFLNIIFSDIKKSKSIANKSVQKSIQQIVTSVLTTGYISNCFEKYLAPYPDLVKKSLRALILTTSFSKHITLNKNKLTSLATAALLHDIGLAKLPDSLLLKPLLTTEERKQIESHIKLGRALLIELKSIDKETLEIVAQHHENNDGSGYDQGLNHTNICFSAKVLRVVTIYEALTRNRIYADKKSKLEALTQLKMLADNHKISKNLVSKFIEMIGIYPKGTMLKLANSTQVKVFQDHADFQQTEETDYLLVESADLNHQHLTIHRSQVLSVIHEIDVQGALK